MRWSTFIFGGLVGATAAAYFSRNNKTMRSGSMQQIRQIIMGLVSAALNRNNTSQQTGQNMQSTADSGPTSQQTLQ